MQAIESVRPPTSSSAGWRPFLLVGAIGVLTWLAWLRRFVLDDAFISFRYADHLARGLGLVWNPGEAVEGYTNFLWTVVMAVPHRLGIDPVVFAWTTSLTLFAFGLAVSFLLVHRLLDEFAAWAVVLLVGTHYTFSAYATGGLETQLQAVLFVTAAWVALAVAEDGDWRPARAAVLSLLFSAALLTRLDSGVMVAVVGGATLVGLSRAPLSARAKARTAAALTVPALLVVGGWLLWKLRTYGAILPNTFYVKTDTGDSLAQGLRFVRHFFFSYGYVLFAPLAVAFARRVLRAWDRRLATLALLVVAWLAYLVWVGGDFMEFRFFVPVVPFLLTLLVFVVFAVTQSPAIRVALLLLLAVGSLRHALYFSRSDGIDEISTLAQALESPAQDWDGVGRRLGELFDRPGCNVVIATTAAGAIPYYSRLETVDMLGLNDRYVARHGRRLGDRVGHTRMAPLDYLLERRVNLIIGHPWVTPIESVTYRRGAPVFLFAFANEPDKLPAGSRFLELPISAGVQSDRPSGGGGRLRSAQRVGGGLGELSLARARPRPGRAGIAVGESQTGTVSQREPEVLRCYTNTLIAGSGTAIGTKKSEGYR